MPVSVASGVGRAARARREKLTPGSEGDSLDMATLVRSVPDTLIGFPPVIDVNTRCLVMGSFPSRASLEASQYYAHPKNHFWPLMGWMFDKVDPRSDYETRIAALLSCGVGIWDVFYSCERSGSMDVDIRNAVFNDFSILKKAAPNLKKVMFNGRTAAKGVDKLSGAGYRTYVLPSTSPAYTLPIFNKFGIWREALAPVY